MHTREPTELSQFARPCSQGFLCFVLLVIEDFFFLFFFGEEGELGGKQILKNRFLYRY